MHSPALSLLALASLFAGTPAQAPAKPAETQPTGEADPLPAPDAAITAAELEHHVRFLASDELGGRAPLSAGAERAARYLARALEAAGVEPAGDAGGWFQATGLELRTVAAPPRLFLTEPGGAVVEAKLGVDFALVPRGRLASTDVLPLDFYYDYNHAAMPTKGDPTQAVHFSATREDKRRILAKKGIATLSDWGLEIEVMGGEEGFEPGRARDSFPPRLVPSSEAEGCELVELRGPLRKRFERREFDRVQLVVEESVAPVQDRNVVGRIRGAGTPERPELAQEVVLLSANYDHDGRLPAREAESASDVLFNGADDNASGCAALLELAQAFAAAKPARTLVFVFTASEDEDNTGSKRYLAAPAEPLERTLAALCLEHLGRPDERAGGAGKLWMTGAGRSSLGAAWAESPGIAPDPRPDLKFFHRFRSHGFVDGGLVAHSLSSHAERPELGTPDDEADTLDYAHLEAAARLAFEAARTLADGSLTPVASARASDEDKAARDAAEREAGRQRLREKLKAKDAPPKDEPKDEGEATDEDGSEDADAPKAEDEPKAR